MPALQLMPYAVLPGAVVDALHAGSKQRRLFPLGLLAPLTLSCLVLAPLCTCPQSIQKGQLAKESQTRLNEFMSTLRNMQVCGGWGGGGGGVGVG